MKRSEMLKRIELGLQKWTNGSCSRDQLAECMLNEAEDAGMLPPERESNSNDFLPEHSLSYSWEPEDEA